MKYLALRNFTAIRLVVFILLTTILSRNLHVFGDPEIDKQHDSDNEIVENHGCFNRTTRVVVEFNSNLVPNEYIVKFDGYFKKSTREKYIFAALNNSQVSF